MAADNPAAPSRPFCLFPLVLLLVAIAVIVALTLTGAALPHRFFAAGFLLPAPGAAPWGALMRNLANAAAYGLYAVPVLGMAGLLAARGFDWGVFAVWLACGVISGTFIADGLVIAASLAATLGVLAGLALVAGVLGWLFAGRLGWGVNRAALLNLLIMGGGWFVILYQGFFRRGWAQFALKLPNAAIPVAFAVMLLVAWWLLARSSVGRRLTAIGADPKAARLAGVDRGWPLFLAFFLSALGMGLWAVNHETLNLPSLIELATGVSRDIVPFLSIVAVPLFLFPLPFIVIVACGGGFAGRRRVSPLALACAALAVPMLDCALSWAALGRGDNEGLRLGALVALAIIGALWQRRCA